VCLAAFATLAGLGIFRPLKMLPILLLEIFYKVLRLLVVAYPLRSAGTLIYTMISRQAAGILGRAPSKRAALKANRHRRQARRFGPISINDEFLL
jgi:hypothetical protein